MANILDFSSIDEEFETRVRPVAPKKPTVKPVRKEERTSRFISGKGPSKFIRGDTPKTNIKELRKEWQEYLKPVEEKIDENVTQVLKVERADKEAFVANLHTSIDELYKFLLQQIVPLHISINPALDKASQVASLIANTDVQITIDPKLQRMLDEAVNLKTFAFFAKQLNLEPELYKLILQMHLAQSENKQLQANKERQ